ncbi:MAG TPA: hypothetical protein VKY74_24590 [Chloroflexia bacterium]|nr:hypothetical protein [Chloroflexia bacterium]
MPGWKFWAGDSPPPPPPPPAPYPYPQLVPLLQVRCSPTEYRHFSTTTDLLRVRIAPDPTVDKDYWSIIPEYSYAQCPLCGQRYQGPADTYSLYGWETIPLYLNSRLYVGTNFPITAPCPHYMGVQRFINLHSVAPLEMTRLYNECGEVPYWTPKFFPADIPGYAVLHALPICQTEEDRFIPRYTLFLLTYFSQDRRTLRARLLAQLKERPTDDQWPEPLTPAGPSAKSMHKAGGYDLAYLVAQGQLGWLDVTQPELPLRIGAREILPPLYQNITGRRHAYKWRDGRIVQTSFTA